MYISDLTSVDSEERCVSLATNAGLVFKHSEVALDDGSAGDQGGTGSAVRG